MELNEMKDMWQKMDAKLQENRLLNEKIMKSMIADRSKLTINKITGMEYLGIATCGILILIYLLMINTIWSSALMTISYFFSLVLIIISLFLGIYNLRLMSAIDLSKSSLIEVAEKTQQFRLLVSREKIFYLVMGPFMLASITVVMFKWIHNIDVANYPRMYFTHMALETIAFIIATIVMYKKLYENSINTIQKNIEEISSFKEEL